MNRWLARNARPIGSVLIAAGVVVGAFEAIDSLTADQTPVVQSSEGAELEGLAALAGLIKVSLFLAVGALMAIPIRRRFTRETTRVVGEG